MEFLGHHVTNRPSAHRCAPGGHPAPPQTHYSEGAPGDFGHHQLLSPLRTCGGEDPEASDRHTTQLTVPSTALKWSEEMAAAFAAALCKTVSLAYRQAGSYGGRLSGACGGVSTAAGGPWQPLGLFPKKLESAQTCYSSFDCELWACFSGIRHFRHMLESRRFILFTDHKPMTQAMFR